MQKIRLSKVHSILLPQILIVGFAIALSHYLSATTCAYGTSVWPADGSIIPCNGIIVLIGAKIPSLCRPGLINADDAIDLAVGAEHRLYENQPSGPATILIPIRPLKPGLRYELVLLNPEGNIPWLPTVPWKCRELKLGTNVQSKDGLMHKPFSWIASGHLDHEPPTWSGKPAIVEATSHSDLGFMDSTITVAMTLEEECIALVELIVEKKYLISTLLPINHDAIQLRSGLCYGPFKLWGGERYQMRLTAIDMAGNRSESSDLIDFCVPDYPPPDEYRMNVTFSPEVEVIERPEISTTEPAKKARIQGRMEIQLTLASDGSVTQVESVKRLPMGLSENAERVLRTWKFALADDSDLRKVMVTIEVRFDKVPYQPVWNP